MAPERVIPSRSAEPELVSLYQKQAKIYPRAVSGWFATWRWTLVWLTQLIFYGLPWLQWNGRPLMLFDLDARRFHVLGLTLFPQDFIYLTALLVLSALALFFFTAVAGRLWCGYACPQTVYTEIFLWLEHRIEGDRQARMRLDKRPWGAEKLLRKGGKHAAWIAVSLFTGFSFVGYFTPVRTLATEFASLDGRPLGAVLGALLRRRHLRQCRLDARADLQIHVPLRTLPERADRPRLDGHRLRPRARRPARLAQARLTDPRALGLGDCVDCTLCVQVCPTGIDIRDGLQNECIGCAACIDACNQVMDRVGSPRGLIRYATENGVTKPADAPADAAPRLAAPGAGLWRHPDCWSAWASSAAWRCAAPSMSTSSRTAAASAGSWKTVASRTPTACTCSTPMRSQARFDVSAQGLPGLQARWQTPLTVAGTERASVTLYLSVPPLRRHGAAAGPGARR
jgi:polyferredoxin